MIDPYLLTAQNEAQNMFICTIGVCRSIPIVHSFDLTEDKVS